jgi:hypothetical protein
VIHLVNTDPPYNVKVEPRSNNAIAAGLSSFTNDAARRSSKPARERGVRHRAWQDESATMHHQGLDLARHPEKAKATHKKMRAKDRPLANDFVTDEAFDDCSMRGSATWLACWKRGAGSTSGAAMPTSATTRRS